MRIPGRLAPGLVLALLSVSAALFGANDALGGLPPPPAETYIVDNLGDNDLQGCTVAINDCTFRGALNKANAHITANGDPDKIQFQISNGVKTFVPTTPLPAITDEVVIDGTTQPAAQGPSCIVAESAPCIRLSGVAVVPNGSEYGLNVAADNAFIKGLAIYSFELGNIRIAGTTASHIERNFIGTPDGESVGSTDTEYPGILIETGGTSIGGTGANQRNIISGNNGPGIEVVSGSSTVITGNYIGTDRNGVDPVPNAGAGLLLGVGATVGGSIGTSPGGDCTGVCNLISGNLGAGIDATGPVTIQGNVIGLDVNANEALGNGLDGIVVHQVGASMIGGTSPSQRNIIAANGGNGIDLYGAGIGDPEGTMVLGNYIGVDTGALAPDLGNADNGIRLSDASEVIIGGTNEAARNLISGNGAAGVQIGGIGNGSSDNNEVLGNYIGTNLDGTSAIPNAIGVEVDVVNGTAMSSVIGGTTAGAGNLISGNGIGVRIAGPGVLETLVQGNVIGLDATGAEALPNEVGVSLVNSINSTVGGSVAGRNIISGNSVGGVALSATVTNHDNVVSSNYIGVGANGADPHPSGDFGVSISSDELATATENVVGGEEPADKNVILAEVGVLLSGAGTSDNIVENNVVKADVSGAIPLGDGSGSGVEVTFGAHNNTIVSNTLVHGEFGLEMHEGAHDNIVQSNFLGTNAAGDAGLQNTKDGIIIDDSSGNLVGADETGEGANLILNNLRHGVLISGTSFGNTLSANSIYNHSLQGIRVIPPANDSQPPPVMGAAVTGSTSVAGTIVAAASQTFRIEFFSTPFCDAAGSGEGLTYLGTTNVSTNGLGNGSFSAVLAPSTPPGYSVSATATDVDGNTSQFSNCASVTGTLPSESPTPTASAGPTPSPTASVELQGDADCDGGIDTQDVVAALSEALEVEPGADCSDLANADCDSNVDAADALRIMRFVIGDPQTPPGGCPQVGSPA